MPETVSACLIVRDEEERLPAALDSVAFCDEIVVVDGGSTDRTVEIARAAGAVVIESPWPGFGAQRNVALDRATSDWVLEIDADEQIMPELQREIRRFLDDPPPQYDMAALPQFHRFLGAELRPSMKYPNYRTRLFRRGSHRHDESRTVHEGLWPKGPVWPFEHEMSHELAASWREALRDMWNYARLEASVLARPESPMSVVVGIFVRPAAKFSYRVLIDGGWRDGTRGLARIALDCVSDALVWILRSLRGTGSGAVGKGGASHFAAGRPPGWGTPLVIAIASGTAAALRAESWLEQAASEGIDVALVTDAAPAGSSVRMRPMRRFGPILLLRALEAERQLRGQCDALLVEGRVARMLMRCVPAALAGREPRIGPDELPSEAKRRAGAATESTPDGPLAHPSEGG